MSQNLRNRIAQKKQNNEKLLSVFITAGFPEADATEEIILTLDQCGVDFIELGIPFSDPVADGPVIQEASDIAIQNGIALPQILEMVRSVRKKTSIPLLLMGYLNPIYRMGINSFLHQAASCGVDGLIIPDWPIEESAIYSDLLRRKKLDLIYLIAPNTPPERLKLIDEASAAFIYCVAYTGVTGQESRDDPETIEFLSGLKKKIKRPVMIGFGVKNHADYARYTGLADGVIVGSAFIRMLHNTGRSDRRNKIKNFIDEIRGTK
jgi:tryptophan synthase alpha chain